MEPHDEPLRDVYAYGVIAASTLIELEGAYPPESGYAETRRVSHSIGGEAAAGAYVLGRLGVSTKLAGSELGADAAARSALEILSGAGVDCSDIATMDGGGVFELVVSSGEQRTIFASYGAMLADHAWSAPHRDDVRSSRMVCLDPFLGADSAGVAQWCTEDGVPYVTIDAPPDSPIVHGAEAVVVGEEFATRTFGAFDPDDLLDAYAHSSSGLIILTRGKDGVLHRRGEGPIQRMPAFEVDALDTTGAGDSFRAGLVYALLQGATDVDAVRTASAVAAMVCETAPGVLASPRADELRTFLAGR